MDDEGQCELEVPLFIELKESKCASNDLGKPFYFAIFMNVRGLLLN